MENRHTAREQGSPQVADQGRKVRQKTGHPPAPNGVKVFFESDLLGQIRLEQTDVSVPALVARGARSGNEPDGPFDGQNAPAWTNDFGQINRRVAGSAPEVHHSGAFRDSSLCPGFEHPRPPNSMLQSQSLDFLVVRA
jgi:hypothetical protein